ncbi:HAMP domain-containing protein [Bacillus subtilis subsp. subtilis]|nr:HAMP domain-containing protein [Bacillus subtilis subsp. subtilis]
MRRSGLSRHIMLSVSLMVLAVIVMMILGSYVLCAVLMEYFPMAAEEPIGWMPTGPELVWMAGVTLIGLVLAVAGSVRLSQRILTPLNSVVDSIGKLAEGDLGARATASDRSLGEVALLVDDFNAMAHRLQSLQADRVMWHAAIAHELRTPVTILRGRLQGLAEGVFAPDQSQFRSLLTQVEGLSRLIEDLRVLSLADNARLELRRARSDVVQEVHSVMSLVDPGFRNGGFVLELETSRDEHPAHCDPIRVRQALMALLENARRYATPGRVRIAVHDTATHVQISVDDEGPGIDPLLGAQIFDPFIRGDGSRSRLRGGSGLGLTVVKAIADAHGGRVCCTASALGGSRFVIELPRQ